MRRLAFRFLLLCLFFQSAPALAAERIVTLAPVISEWVAEILGEPAALHQLVGVSEYSVYPTALKAVPTIGPYPQLNIEKIAGLHPDLVIASSEYNRPEQLEQLRRLQLNVQVLPAEKFGSMNEWIEGLAKILDAPKEGARATKTWSQKIDELGRMGKTHPKQKLFLEIQHQPLITVGGQSFLNDGFRLVGRENIFSNLKQGYPKVSKEAVLKMNPDLILILDLTGVKEDFEKAKSDWQSFSDLSAVKHKTIQTIPGDDFARCSFRFLEALKKL